jgi:hypothetical protein
MLIDMIMFVWGREPTSNLADNLLRDFEERWWKCCKEVTVLTLAEFFIFHFSLKSTFLSAMMSSS